IGHDGAAADLAAAVAGVLHAAVIAPLARVIHIGFALLEQATMARERIYALLARDAGVGRLFDAPVAVGPLEPGPPLGEQALVIGDEFRQPLERRRRFQHQLFHRWSSLARQARPNGPAKRINGPAEIQHSLSRGRRTGGVAISRGSPPARTTALRREMDGDRIASQMLRALESHAACKLSVSGNCVARVETS